MRVCPSETSVLATRKTDVQRERMSKVGAQDSIENCLSPKEVPEKILLNIQGSTEHSLKTIAVGESVSACKVQDHHSLWGTQD